MKRHLVSVLALGLGVAALSGARPGAPIAAAPQRAITVCAEGCEHTRIQAAIDAASFGDTILIGAGLYVENLVVRKSLTLRGLDRSTSIVDGGGVGSVLFVDAGTAVTLSSLTLRGGSAETGSAILNLGAVTVRDCDVTGNRSLVASSFGGALFNYGGTVLIEDSALRGNEASYGGAIFNTGEVRIYTSRIEDNIGRLGGGAIYNRTGYTLLNAAHVSGNRVSTSGYGGALYNADLAAVANSVFANNFAAEFGGALYQYAGGLYVSNTTLSANEGAYGGGAIYILSGESVVTSSTLARNRGSIGGAINNNEGYINVINTIVADSPGANCFGTITSDGYNLDSGNTCGFTGAGDKINTDARLGELRDNGGFSITHALQPGSAAIDAGDLAGCLDYNGYDLTTDQRGYERTVDGDGDGDAICDIGAYEHDPANTGPRPTPTPAPPSGDVTVCPTGCGHTTIQAAVDAATAGMVVGIGRGTYEENVVVAKSLTLRGSGASVTTIDGGFNGPVVLVEGASQVRIEGLTLTRGEGVVSETGDVTLYRDIVTLNSGRRSGGVYSGGDLVVEETTIVGNISLASGGGIHAAGGSVVVRGSTVTGNRSALDGGGLFARGAWTVERSTFSGNEGRYGGAIAALGDGAVQAGTITANRASYGGGLYVNDAEATMTGGELTRNEGDVGGGAYCAGQLTFTNTAIEENVASDRLPAAQYGYGGAIFNEDGQVVVSGGRLQGNRGVRAGGVYNKGGTTRLDGVTATANAASYGGAVFASGGTLEVAGGGLSGNLSYVAGGAGYVLGGRIDVHDASVDANDSSIDGGGFYVRENGTLAIARADVVTNTAPTGGGLYSVGTTTLTDVRVAANLATGREVEQGEEIVVEGGYGGGLHVAGGTTTLARAVALGNTALYGGAASVAEGALRIENATLMLNAAEIGGGGVFGGGGEATLRNVTLEGNGADPEQLGGGAILVGSGIVDVGHAILGTSPEGDNCRGNARSNGYNIDGDGTCRFASNGDRAADPKVGELVHHGRTSLFELLPDSPAVDGGDAACRGVDGAPLQVDQRGGRRPIDGNEDGTARCDIGAFEWDPNATPPPTPTRRPTVGPTPTATRTALPPGGEIEIFLPLARNQG